MKIGIVLEALVELASSIPVDEGIDKRGTELATDHSIVDVGKYWRF